MRRTFIRLAVAAVLISGAALAHAFSTGPPLSETGARAVGTRPAEGNCSLCHQPSGLENTDPNGSLKIVGLPTQYQPGVVYPFEVHLNYDWSQAPSETPVKWGFEMTAVFATTGDSAGTWILGVPPDSFRLRRYATSSPSALKRRVYIEHTIYDYHLGENQDGQSGPIVFHLNWVAPMDSTKVYFFVAGNAANGDSCSICGGDHIYTTSDSTVGGTGNVSVPIPNPSGFLTSLEDPFPNPFTQCLDLKFGLARAGLVDFSVFDLQGRKIRSLMHERLQPSQYNTFWNGKRDDGTQARNGVYFVRLMAPGLKAPLTRKVTLSR